MTRPKAVQIVIALVFVSACSIPVSPIVESYRWISDFGPEHSVETLPKAQEDEVFLGFVRQPNGKVATTTVPLRRGMVVVVNVCAYSRWMEKVCDSLVGA